MQNVDLDVLRKRLADTLEYARQALEKMSREELETVRVLPSGKRELTVAWALLHALEHTTLHLGQIQLTRQLWEQSKQSD